MIPEDGQPSATITADFAKLRIFFGKTTRKDLADVEIKFLDPAKPDLSVVFLYIDL